MSGFLPFCDKYKDEATCIKAFADLRWPNGFTCDKCNGIKAYHLTARPRIFECAACGHQHSITAGTVFHKTRTDLRKWFLAAYLIGHDKRGVSAMFVSRELGLRYDTAWLMCHKLRHVLTESPNFKLEDYVEIDEAFYGGRRQKGNRGRAQTGGKAMIVCAVEKRSTAGTTNKGINKQGFVAGDARIAIIPNGTAVELGGFIQSAIEPATWIISDGYKGYSKSSLTGYRHIPITHTGNWCQRGLGFAHRPQDVFEHQGMAERNLSRREHQALAPVSAGVELPVQSPGVHSRFGPLPLASGCGTSNHHLRPACSR